MIANKANEDAQVQIVQTHNLLNLPNKRIGYLDLLKTISIFLVIYVHYPWISNSKGSNLTMIMTIIAVPLFFMVNGALLLGKKNFNIKEHYKKLMWIIVGTISWKILILFICLITKRVDILNFSVTEIFNYLFTAENLLDVPAEHLWFMYSLIRIYIIYPFIRLAFEKDNKYLKYILLYSFIFSFGIELLNMAFFTFSGKGVMDKLSGITSTFSPINDLTYITYFILGYILHNKFYKEQNVFEIKKIILPIFIYLFGLMLVLVARYVQVGTLLDGAYQRIHSDYTKMGDLIMTCAVFILFCKIPIKENKFINFIGSRTINIYYVHMILVAYSSTYLLPLFNKWVGFKLNFIRTIIILGISIIITEIMKKIKPLKKILYLS